MQLHLIRHGETTWNAERRVQGWAESELTELGRQQARDRAQALAAIDFTAAWCSTSIRTRQTAALLCEHRELPLHYRPNLREMHLGPWEGLLWDDINAQNSEQSDNFRRLRDQFHLEGAETFVSMQARGVAELEAIIAESATASDVLVVSHGAIIKGILALYSGLTIRQLSAVPGLSNCSHSIIATDGNERHVRLIDGQSFEDSPWPAVIEGDDSGETDQQAP